MDDYWVDDGCIYGTPFFRHTPSKVILRRKEFLDKWSDGPNYERAHPFIHDFCSVKDPWFKGGWFLDPLVIPLIRFMNKIDGIETFSSCQGCADRAPIISFTSTLEGVGKLYEIFRDWNRKGRYYDNVLISYTGNWDEGRNSWSLIFYDIFSLIAFTEEYLEIPLDQQIALSDVEYLEPNPDYKTPIAPIEEMKEILKESKCWN